MKVLLIHASLGWGHKRAAMAVQEELAARGIAAEVVDMLDYLPGPLPRFYPWAYSFMVTRARWLWRWFYEWNDHSRSPYAPANSVTQRWQFNRLRSLIEQGGFSHIVSTHFTAAALLTDWRKQRSWNTRIFSIVTDYTSHRCWKREGLDHYFVATDEVREQMKAAGLQGERITTTGIPISTMFRAPLSREECRRTWNAGDGETLILVLSSGLNMAKTRAMIRDLREAPGRIRYLVSAGADTARERQVRDLCRGDDRFTVFGFSNRIAEMMKAADLLISKPGGLTTSEAMASGLPQILFSPIPGQEEANADYVSRQGAGLCIEARPGAFRDALASVSHDPSTLTCMARRARELGRPDAASRIVDILLKG
ncbi:MAG TPA: glycosyltransferase [Acidobacteriota bacterium]|nr:glycosyltransferase [Acidobacteriota bacterium]